MSDGITRARQEELDGLRRVEGPWEETAGPISFGSALPLPGASTRAREPTRLEAANDIWDTDEA